MRDRRTMIAVLVVVLAYVGFTAIYLTRFTFGDPFSGTWRLNPDDPYVVVIKLARSGYSIAIANGQTSSGWVSARRSGNVLTAMVRVLDSGEPTSAASTTTLVFRSWNGHLVETDHDLNMVLTKMSGSTSIPPRQAPVIGGSLSGAWG